MCNILTSCCFDCWELQGGKAPFVNDKETTCCWNISRLVHIFIPSKFERSWNIFICSPSRDWIRSTSYNFVTQPPLPQRQDILFWCFTLKVYISNIQRPINLRHWAEIFTWFHLCLSAITGISNITIFNISRQMWEMLCTQCVHILKIFKRLKIHMAPFLLVRNNRYFKCSWNWDLELN